MGGILEANSGTLTTYASSSKTNVQDIRPLANQRGVGLDGSVRAGSSFPLALAGNPFESGGGADGTLAGVRLDVGTAVLTDVDIALPAPGFSWVIARSYNARQHDGSNYFNSGGYQGKNWFQMSQPELVYYNPASDSNDVVYLVYGADRYIEFKWVSNGTTPDDITFKAVNGAAGVLVVTINASNPDLAVYTDQHGNKMTFFWVGDSDIDDDVEGSIWKIADPAGNVAYVGDSSSASTAISSGFDTTTGAITKAYDSADRRYTYTYTSSRLTEVKAETKTGGTWASPTGLATVAEVDYTYYGNETYGDDGGLKLVTITTPLTDSGVSLIGTRYFRYWEGTFNASTNPGHPYGLQYIIDFEGTRRFDYSDANFNDSFLTATESNLKPYASAYFEYDSDHRITKTWGNGACGCSGASAGTHELTYGTNGSFSGTSGYDTTWYSRTIVKLPAKNDVASPVYAHRAQYFDELGQPITGVVSDADPSSASNFWVIKVTRDGNGCVTHVHTPANLSASGYTHSTGAISSSASVGLVNLYQRITSGETTGFVQHVKFREGYSATNSDYTLQSSIFYETVTKSVGGSSVVRPLPKVNWAYTAATTTEATEPSGPGGANKTAMAYTYHTGDGVLMPKQITTTYAAVTTGNNGSNSSNTSKLYLRKDGTTAFSEAADGAFTYTKHTNGQMTKSIVDAQTNHGSDFASGDDPNTDFGITESGTGLRHITTMSYDAQGRSDVTTRNAQSGSSDQRFTKMYYSRLASRLPVTLRYADFDESVNPDKFYGPVSYTVSNLAGRTEAQALVELANNESTTALTGHVDEADADLITAMDLGAVTRLTTSVHDESGTEVQETRAYSNVPGSGAGSDPTNYDATTYAYDNAGRQWRVKAPTGTITRTRYDDIGRPKSQWIGTNDNDGTNFPGGESAGTSNMVEVSRTTYDGGSASGNSYVTTRTAYIQDNDTDDRETTFTHDFRGRAIVQVNPTAPHVLNKFDNLSRLIATGQYSSSSGLDAGDDPTSLATNRMALSQSFYDEVGRAWKTQRHQIDDADGSDDDNLQALSWFDSVGRQVKQDGEQLVKTKYDRAGRATHRFILASDNDSVYADADDVTGDIVLEEQQTTFDPDNGDVIMRAGIARHHDDTSTTGALDSNADGDDLLYTAANVAGRIQITAIWFDARLARVTDNVQYGTNGGSNFDRDGLSVPSRSDTELVTSTSYNTDGTVKEVTDPRAKVTRHEYDDAGRQTAVIANYVNGTPSGSTGDDDLFTRFVYVDGLRTKMWVDIDGDNVEDAGTDQVTLYTYGVAKGASAGDSKIASGHHLWKAQYPDSSGGTDVVSFAYNAQGQQIYTKDQAGNVIESDYDTSGRTTHKRATTIQTGSGFDDHVKRISTTYDSLGRVQLITQYDNATVGSGTVRDEIKYTHDDWGPVALIEQDVDSTVGAGSGNGDYEVSYAYAKAGSGGGRNTIRPSTMTIPGSLTITFGYTGSGTNTYDDAASRIGKMTVGATRVGRYDYLGVSHLVGVEYPEPDLFSYRYSGSPATYGYLDRFGRVVNDYWYKNLATDRATYNTAISYDRNGNITVADEAAPHSGVDVQYTIDGVNRLTKAEEGTWNGSAITSRSRQQLWTLTQTGNWSLDRIDLNGDNDFADPGSGDVDDSRTHNEANELTDRDLDTDGDGYDDAHYDLMHDAVGNLTDDVFQYEYVHDVFGRLRKVKNTSTQALVEEYWYYGNGWRKTMHYDTTGNSVVDGSDQKYHLVYDAQWRNVATFRGSDANPKEQFIYNASAGSKLDDVFLRYRDMSNGWAGAADGTLEQLRYMCGNWRGDVVAVLTDSGAQVEQVRYSAYGVPFGLNAGDANSDGLMQSGGGNTTDSDQIQTWINGAVYDVRGDLDLDGDVDAADKTACQSNNGSNLGRGKLSLSSVGNRKGYGGYEADIALEPLMHVRHRVLHTTLGRWTRRDPIGYVDGPNLYGYARENPLAGIDPMGTECAGAFCTGSTGTPTGSSASFSHHYSKIDEICPNNDGRCNGGGGGGQPPLCDGAGCRSVLAIWSTGSTPPVPVTLPTGGWCCSSPPAGFITTAIPGAVNFCLTSATTTLTVSCPAPCSCALGSPSFIAGACAVGIPVTWSCANPWWLGGGLVTCTQTYMTTVFYTALVQNGTCVAPGFAPQPGPGPIAKVVYAE